MNFLLIYTKYKIQIREKYKILDNFFYNSNKMNLEIMNLGIRRGFL